MPDTLVGKSIDNHIHPASNVLNHLYILEPGIVDQNKRD